MRLLDDLLWWSSGGWVGVLLDSRLEGGVWSKDEIESFGGLWRW